MFSSIMVSLFALIFIIIFILYKRNLLSRILPDNSAAMTNQFKEQLEQTADTVLAQLENKIVQLEALLNEADAKIVELENRLITIDAAAMLSDQQRDKLVERYTALQQVNIGQDTVPSRAIIEVNSQVQPDAGSKTATEDDDKRRLVLAMAEQGYNITEIAKATGKGKGEIMLLLQLNKR
ncbi:hypothetical protein SDC9_115876 [bioreactor metagenome]|uniref:Uncharacterized protein n=1 Tax=bioreactor metagenome TaxID=1076179 RepID=A0A645BU33_9ZZZZ